MKKINLTITFLLFSLIIFGQNSLLWKISGNGLESPSYLFGTIHVICPDDFFLPEQLSPALKECQQLYLEIDMTDPTMMQKMQGGMMNANMKNIKADLNEEQTKLVDEALKKAMGFGLDQLGIMKPWALSAMIGIRLSLECQQPSQYETELIKLAKTDSKPVKGLETVEDQLALFNNLPYEEQIEMLVETVSEKEKTKALFKKMVDMYKAQNIDELFKLIMEQEDMERFGSKLLDERNAKWIPVIEEAIAGQPCFIAVGAGHLPGKKGVIELLKEKGYKVKAVK